FNDEEFALGGLRRFSDMDALAQARMKRLPDDLDALRAVVQAAVDSGDYAQAVSLGENILKQPKAEAEDLNDVAWYALYTGKVDDSIVNMAVRAAQMGKNDTSILHTLACVYAEAGKTKEAREVLMQAMEADNMEEPNPSFWYAFGRIADQYGLRDTALQDYAKVTKPEHPAQIPASTYLLAQIREKALGAPGTSSNKQ
ncbi:MAG: tetratricopeptide repeat protein, partial [Bryobacteraceae bacterium]